SAPANTALSEPRTMRPHIFDRRWTLRTYLVAPIIGTGLTALRLSLLSTTTINARGPGAAAMIEAAAQLKLPTGYRKWRVSGAPRTPNGLNNGKAGFPEFHHVYVEQKNVDAYLKTGAFPEGTVIVKELTRVLKPEFPDGSRTEPSGRGYFNGEYNGMDVTVKDS